MKILKIQIKEKWFKFLGIQFYKKQYIEIYFNYLENRLYYKDKNKDIPTGKDLSRTIKMTYEMIKRTLAFDGEYKLINDNFNKFIISLMRSMSEDVYSIIFGTQVFNVKKLFNYCDALSIDISNCKVLLNELFADLWKPTDKE